MKKTILMLAVLFATVYSSLAQTTAHPEVYWTGSSGWLTADGNYWTNYYESANYQVNINSNLGAFELYGYGVRGTNDNQTWVSIECYDASYSYYKDYFVSPSYPYGVSYEINEFDQYWSSPQYFATFYVNMAASGTSGGRLVVNWAAI